jgi:hypothetical protein
MHEHELELAAAALDFELTPAERARLDRAIAECSVCAGAATAYRRQATLLQALPVVDASPAVRVHIERTADLRPQRTSWTWAILAAALLGLVLTGVLIAGSNLNRQNSIVDVAPTPVPSTSPAPSEPSPAPSPDVIALDPPSGELANVGPALARDSLAAVVTDNLRLRSAPFVGDLSVRHKRLLQPDDRLFIVDGPVIAQNYEWYQVKAWRQGQPSVSWPVGWVARAGHDGEVWIGASTRACPSQPVDIDALLDLAPVERLGCFGDTQIDVRAVVNQAQAGDCDVTREGCPTGPGWLTASSVAAGASPTSTVGDGIPLSIEPGASIGADNLAVAGVVRLRGAFDHPDSSGCRPDPARAGPDGPLSSVEAVLRCRSQFVVTDAVEEPFPRRSDVPAITVSDRLRVRSLPEISEASIRYEPLVPIGTRLWVVDGPTLANGYAWYKVVAPFPESGGTGSSWLTGWVAAAGLDGERWIESVEIDCPTATEPLSLADLARIRQRPLDDGPLACFGASTIELEGQVRLACGDGTVYDAQSAAWLSHRLGRWVEIIDGDERLEARIDPAGAAIELPCDTLSSGRYRVRGHFDDPTAQRCAVPIQLCRTYFVAESVAPLGSTAPPPRPSPRR